MPVTPYLVFGGRAEEAIAFYKHALGAEVLMMLRFKDSPEKSMNPPGTDDKIMHASLRIKGGELGASDGDCGGLPTFSGISLTFPASTVDEADRVFAALSDGGKVHAPLMPTFFSPKFGVVTDKFGVNWMVLVQP
jgi:PhnB protein